MDKDEYDRPEDQNNFMGRVWIFIVLALVVIGIFYAIFNTDVFR